MNFESKTSVVFTAGRICGFLFSFFIFSAVLYFLFFYTRRYEFHFLDFIYAFGIASSAVLVGQGVKKLIS